MVHEPDGLSQVDRLERTIQALCDEIFWGLRNFYAAKILEETEVRLTPTLFDTFYFACLDQRARVSSHLLASAECTARHASRDRAPRLPLHRGTFRGVLAGVPGGRSDDSPGPRRTRKQGRFWPASSADDCRVPRDGGAVVVT